jgi:hypothetical protein
VCVCVYIHCTYIYIYICLHIHVCTPIYMCIYIYTYIYTYTHILLTPWSSVLLEKLIGSQLVKKFPTCYGIRRFITAFTTVLHLSLSQYQPMYEARVSCFVTKPVFTVRSGQHLARLKEDHPLSTVRDYLFNTFAATFHIGDRSSIRNLRTPHAEVTGTHLSHVDIWAK